MTRVATIAASSSVEPRRADARASRFASARDRARRSRSTSRRCGDGFADALAACDAGVVRACATDDDVALVATVATATTTRRRARSTRSRASSRDAAATSRARRSGGRGRGSSLDGRVRRAGARSSRSAKRRRRRRRDDANGGGDADDARAGGRADDGRRSRARASGCHLVAAPACEATPRAGVGDVGAGGRRRRRRRSPSTRTATRTCARTSTRRWRAIVREASEDEATRAAATAMLVGGAVRAPVTNGRARMGTWQGLYLCEHGARGEHARDVLAVCDAREATARTTIVVSAGKRGLRDITDDVTAAIRDAHRPGTIGTLHCFCEHTSASLVVGPSDPTFATRFEDALNDIVPESWNDEFFRHTAEGPDDMPAHVKSTIVGAHKTVPVDADGTLSPLNGQRLYLCEHRNVGGFNSGLARRVTLTLQCD